MELIKRSLKWALKTFFTVVIVVIVISITLGVFFTKLSYENTKVADIPDGSYLLLSFSAPLNESPGQGFNIAQIHRMKLNSKELLFPTVLNSIKKAAEDKRIKGIIIDMDNWNLSASHTSEISREINRFKSSGRSVSAVGTGIDKNGYTAALEADEILLDPSGSSSVLLNGYSYSVPYIKGLTDILGIGVNVIHIGDFKGSGENFTRKTMSENMRATLSSLIDSRFEMLAERISEKRNIPLDKVKGFIENGKTVFISSEKCKELHLVDRILSFDDLKEERAIKSKNLINIADYAKDGLSIIPSTKDKIAVITAEGNIVNSSNGSISETGIYPAKIFGILEKIKKDKSIKAVVLRVNSPGGSSLASELILRKLNELKAEIPLIVSMGGIAASGGYYISCQADKIYAEPYTVTGSIGVMAMIPYFKQISENLGINHEKLKRGKFSDIFDLTKDMTEGELQLIRDHMERIYAEFKQRVSHGRDIGQEDLEKIAQGKIWTAEDAKKNGLIDEIGGLYAAIDGASEACGSKDYDVVYFPENKPLFERIFQAQDKSMTAVGLLKDIDIFESGSEIIQNIIMYQNEPVTLMPLNIDF